MVINFSDKLMEKVNKEQEDRYGIFARDLKLRVRNSIGGATIFKNDWGICTVEELRNLIEQLTFLKETIEEESGLVF